MWTSSASRNFQWLLLPNDRAVRSFHRFCFGRTVKQSWPCLDWKLSPNQWITVQCFKSTGHEHPSHKPFVCLFVCLFVSPFALSFFISFINAHTFGHQPILQHFRRHPCCFQHEPCRGVPRMQNVEFSLLGAQSFETCPLLSVEYVRI